MRMKSAILRSAPIFATMLLGCTTSEFSYMTADRQMALARELYSTDIYNTFYYTNSVLDNAEIAVDYDRDTDRIVFDYQRDRRDWRPGRVRWLEVDGVRNVRDCGGWNGLRPGRMYRGAEMDGSQFRGIDPNNPDAKKHANDLTEKGREVMRREMRIACDLDLRKTEGRVQHSPIGDDIRLELHPVKAYKAFLEDKDTSARCLKVFADEHNFPIYVHCAGGADRTGTVCALIEGLCGAQEADVCTDYELTTYGIGRRARTDRPYGFATLMSEVKKRNGSTLAEKIADLMENHFGLTKDEIAAIRRNLRKNQHASPAGQ